MEAELLILFVVGLLAVFWVFNGCLASGKAPIKDRYPTLELLQDALRASRMEECNLIVGIDFTKSNVDQGAYSFGGRSLHWIDVLEGQELNPYQRAIRACVTAVGELDEDRVIPTYAFGDVSSRTTGVSLMGQCYGFDGIMQAYRDYALKCVLSGPTNFGPLIREACRIARGSYHILLIFCDGQVTNPRDTADALREACAYPLSIVVIGVGDGPWDDMQMYDDLGAGQEWDNVQFVRFNEHEDDRQFACRVLQEVPEQFAHIREHVMKNK